MRPFELLAVNLMFDRTRGPTNASATSDHSHTADGNLDSVLSTTDAYSHARADGQVLQFSRPGKHPSAVGTASAVTGYLHRRHELEQR
jgi:hypothetical protein